LYSCIITVPDRHRDAANQLGESLGWGPENFSVYSQTVDLWYCHFPAGGEFLSMLSDPPPFPVPVQVVYTDHPDRKVFTEEGLHIYLSTALWGGDHWNILERRLLGLPDYPEPEITEPADQVDQDDWDPLMYGEDQ
jgi:hypothetical protein